MARKNRYLWLVGLLLCTVVSACGKEAAEGPLPVRDIRLVQGEKSVPLTVELALTEPTRAHGLMFRKEMPEDHGMLFVWPRAEQRGFWMRNTLIPLDMIFFKDGRAVAIVIWAKPLDESSIAPEQEADIVLETNGGWVERHGVEVGATLEVSGGLPPASP